MCDINYSRKKRTRVQPVFLLIGCLITLIGIVASGITLYNQPRRTGDFTQNPDSWLMDFEVLQGSFSHTLELQEGDTLVVHLERERGSFDVNVSLRTLVGDDVEVLSSIYTGDDVSGGDFELPILDGGTYKISVNGHHAKGVANFTVKK